MKTFPKNKQDNKNKDNPKMEDDLQNEDKPPK